MGGAHLSHGCKDGDSVISCNCSFNWIGWLYHLDITTVGQLVLRWKIMEYEFRVVFSGKHFAYECPHAVVTVGAVNSGGSRMSSISDAQMTMSACRCFSSLIHLFLVQITWIRTCFMHTLSNFHSNWSKISSLDWSYVENITMYFTYINPTIYTAQITKCPYIGIMWFRQCGPRKS